MIGKAVRRREDPRLLTGAGRYVGDIHPSNLLHVAFLRSPHAHATIARVDASAALEVDGVESALAGADVAALGHLRGHLWTTIPPAIQSWLKPTLRRDLQPLLPTDRVRFVGQPVALVAADSRYRAEDALEAIEVEYEPLPPLIDPELAAAPDAPRLEPTWDDNVALHVHGTVGNPDDAFARAAARTKRRVHLRRQTGTPMETRGAVARYEPGSGELTVWCNTQIPHALREVLSEMLTLPDHRVRVVVVDTGGGFGIKGIVYPEEILVALLALRTSRPVKWIEDRQEHMVGSIHARDQVHDVELCADADGRLLAVRDRFLVDIGAFNPLGLTSAANTVAHLVGPYRIPAVEVDGRVVVTNKTVAAPYRGAGRPEAVWALERSMDRLARAMALDPVEVRRRNTLTAAEMPFDTGMYYRDGQPLVYDSGDHLGCLEKALASVGYEGFRERQSEAFRQGRYLGLGVAAYVEGTGIGPFEGATVRVDTTGKVIVHTGACSQGQGQETVFAQICAEWLGVPFEDVTVVVGDTGGIAYGWGTIASRSTALAGSAIAQASAAVRAKALQVGAELLEAAIDDVRLEQGRVLVVGAPQRSVTLREVAEACAPQRALPDGREPGLASESYFRPETVTYANGVHAATVEVEPATGEVRILRYVVVHDCGRVVNPLLADGQVRGGVAQGIGSAFFEELAYDDSGQLLTTTFMDYLVPTAVDVPPIVVEHLESPSPRNPLGVKGLGEGGLIPVPAALAGAIEDALQPFAVEIDEAPFTPDAVRALLRAAATRTEVSPSR